MAELGAMAHSAAQVRVFSDDGKCVSDSQMMRRALEYVRQFDGVVAQHAQDPKLTVNAQMNEGTVSARLGLRGWPAVAEEGIIARDVLLASHVKSRLHICHVSTAGSVDIIRWAKSRGIDVTAEVTPHHLLLSDELVESYDPKFKVNPPLRSNEDIAALRMGLADGTIDIVATDHAPHPAEDKECEWAGAANGMIGLETALSVVQKTMVDTGLLNWSQVADRMSITPANLIEKVDVLAIGGGMVFTFISALGHEIGKSMVDVELIENVKGLIKRAEELNVKLLLPTDVVVAPTFSKEAPATVVSVNNIPVNQMGLDIGPDSAKAYALALQGCETVFWNGPMGVFEFPAFANGTRAVAQALSEISGFCVVGGGDSAAAIRTMGFDDEQFGYISTGGGASLEYLEGKLLPGLIALES